ncbi:deoxynucleoside triphosphate triphosphohydrolase SAMHD1 isoform X3 [Zootermopsis nevadensis]|uniref:deoxynucleoside triphosphate triphosphohydrolase SAMHD1 isoform X3 n=1 Tax=Zootermopsis nevadensis TaxID=136037 RepID=UPI000B8EDB31|nr:deoxynucleoside triphosphate triphosphohydrolase SAMHD1 isoform X3 [Zootermopsis nevadensis]
MIYALKTVLKRFVVSARTWSTEYVESNMGDFKVFNDCIHGHIKLNPLCVKIVDTPQFQRLRNLKQLGPAYFLYPGACHNRFEHSLGVCHLAGKMVEALRRNSDKNIIITDGEKLCLEIAGLCHDLGHGPMSHTWGKFLQSQSGSTPKKWEHEEASVMMFEYLLENNGLREAVKDAVPEMKENAIQFIEELIRGKGTVRSNKKFLYQIISNQENGIDVDRWDYFLRDAKQLNLNISFDYSRILEFCRVIEVNNEKIICFRDKERHSIYDMFQVRMTLFHKACLHDVVRTIEEMFIDALKAADEGGYMIHVSDDIKYKLSEAHKYAKALNRMTDHIIFDIFYNIEGKFKEAKELLCRILKRDLYTILDSKNFSAELLARMNNTQEVDKVNKAVAELEKEIQEHIREISKDLKYCSYKDFKAIKIKLDMGVKKKRKSEKNNPFSNIYFFEKDNVDEAKEMEWKDVTVFPVPEESIHHIHFLIIYKDMDNKKRVSRDANMKKELDDFRVKLKESWGTFGNRSEHRVGDM